MRRTPWVSSKPLGRCLVERLLQLWRRGNKRLGVELRWNEIHWGKILMGWRPCMCAHTKSHTLSTLDPFLQRLPLQCSVFSCLRILQRAGRSKKRFCPSSESKSHDLPFRCHCPQGIGDHSARSPLFLQTSHIPTASLYHFQFWHKHFLCYALAMNLTLILTTRGSTIWPYYISAPKLYE